MLAIYKGVEHLSSTLNSIFNQEVSFDYEVILVSDGNTDTDVERIKEICKEKVILIINKTNLGLTKSLIAGIDVAKGKYIARIDVGDLMCRRDRLQRQFDILESYPNAVITGHRYYLYSSYFKRLFASKPLKENYVVVEDGHTLFGHVTVCFSRKAYHLAGGYNIGMKTGQDTELWPRLLKHGIAVADNEFYTLVSMFDSAISVNRNTEQYVNKIKRSFAAGNYIVMSISLVKLLIPRKLRLYLMYNKAYLRLKSVRSWEEAKVEYCG